MIRHSFRVRMAVAAAWMSSFCAPADTAAAQTIWEDVRLTELMVSNSDAAQVRVYFDKQVCENGQTSAVILKASPSYSFLVSMAMAALASNRKARVETLLAEGDACAIQSFTLLK